MNSNRCASTFRASVFDLVLKKRQENFFRNFGSIIIFAFFGTFISAVGVGYVRTHSPSGIFLIQYLSPTGQSARIYILLPRPRVAGYNTSGVFDFRFNTLRN